MTTLHPQPTRYKWQTWIYLGLLYTHEEMTAKYDYVAGVWHERIVHVAPLAPRVKDRYLQRRMKEQAR